MVATLQEDGKSASLLWEALAPQPISTTSKKTNHKVFMITPSIRSKRQEEEEEIIANMEEIQELLPFERKIDENLEGSIGFWKDRGDQLLRLGDASSAASYYEVALEKSNDILIGGSIVIQLNFYTKLAEVDCMEDDSVDVTIVDSGEEATISKANILLGVLDSDKDHMQERILLNLARCMIQLSEIDAKHRPNYLKSAVLACSLAISISSFHNQSNEATVPANTQTALLLRAKAQSGLSKWPNAVADAKQLIKAGNDEGHKLLESLQKQKKLQGKQDKKLAKEMARWVQTAASESVSDTRESSTTSVATSEAFQDSSNAIPEAQHSFNSSSLLLFLLPLIAAFLIQIMLNKP
jgi:tetratricopeptide (TPR) repeat protein